MEQLIDFHAPEVQAVLDTLLKDKSTGKNIIWATDPPEELQTVMYEPVTDKSPITAQQLRLTHYEVVLPRVIAIIFICILTLQLFLIEISILI